MDVNNNVRPRRRVIRRRPPVEWRDIIIIYSSWKLLYNSSPTSSAW